MDSSTLVALQKLDSLLTSYQRVVVAFSGGVDSSFLLARAKKVLGEQAIAVTVSSELTTSSELERAQSIAALLTVKHIIAQTSVLKNVFFVTNDKDRCYHCKTEVFSNLVQLCKNLCITNLLDGSNLDDDKDFRPGKKALQELSVLSPLKTAGFTKKMIREAARAHGLSNWDLPANSCAATRISYGQKITSAALEIIKSAEAYLIAKGYTNVRLRVHGELVRIEVAEQQIMRLVEEGTVVSAYLQKKGFKWITIDLAGYKLGSMN